MNRSLLAMMNDAEQELVRDTEADALAALDEDELLELHTRVRRARNKYSKLYRRRGAEQVSADAARGRASTVNAKTAAKAEVFEAILARVSRRLATVADQAAKALRDERLATARSGGGGAAARGSAKSSGPTATKATRGRAKTAKRSPIEEKKTASARGAGKRAQARRDQR